MVIQDLHNPNLVVAIGSVDLQSHLYKFYGFDSSNSIGVSIISHVDIVKNLWHENFFHVYYRYLYQMST